ncbi:MAG: RecF/RecN/SMC N-terminal protein [Firmicutes bacterium]|nr:RecF/RecN/SMC N-terminal protein [Bacillota bacterium]
MEPLLELVAAYVRAHALGEPIVDPAHLPGTCPLAVRTEGSLAFFRQTAADRLEEQWREAQTEIAELPAERLPLRKLYLTLLVPDSDMPLPVWQHIMRDLHVCRKLVVAAARQPMDDWIGGLPFLRIPEKALRPRVIITPADALYQAGFRADLANHLLARSAEKLMPEFGKGDVLRDIGEAAPRAMELRAHATYRRLHKIDIQNFRPFARTRTLPLDADLTLIYGPNGSGKSSVAQALEWAVIGEVSTLEQKHDDIGTGDKIPPYINVMNPDSPAVVRLHVQDESGGGECVLERQVDRDGHNTIRWGGRHTSISDVLTQVLDANLPVIPHYKSLMVMARQSHFLDQETIRDFLSTNAANRYSALANMVGTVDFERARDKLKDVAKALENNRAEAQQAEQEVMARLEGERRLLADLRLQLERAGTDGGSMLNLSGAAAELATGSADLGLPVRPEVPADTAGLEHYAQSLLDGLEAARPVAQERHARLAALAAQEPHAHKATEDAVELRDRQAATERDLTVIQAELAAIEGILAGRRVQREAAEGAWAESQQQARAASSRLTAMQALAEAGHSWMRARQAEADAAAELKAAEVGAREVRAAADATTARGRALVAHQERLRDRLAILAELRNRLPAVEAASATEQQAGQALADLARRQAAEQRELQTVLRNLAEVENQVAELSMRVRQLEQRCAERQRLLSALSRHLDGSRCPLCAHDWEEAELLYRQVQEALRESPPELLTAQQTMAAEAGRLDMLQLERDQATIRLSTLEAEAREWERRAARARATIVEWQRLAATVADGEPLPLSPSAALLERWEAACRGADRSAELTALAPERSASEQRAATAEARRNTASQALQAAAAATIRAEPRYRTAEQAAPAGVSRPVPGPDEVAAAEQQLEATTRAAQTALESLRTAREELQAADAARGARTLAQASVMSRLATISQDLRAAEQRHSTHMAALAGADLSDEPGAPARALAALQARLARLNQLSEQATWLVGATQVRLLNDAAAAAAEQVARVEEELAEAHRQTEQWERALTQAGNATSALNGARADEQNKRLMDYEPTINEIYRRINPHPYFPVIRLEPVVGEDKGTLTMHASTPDGRARLPVQRYFSMAQSNVVALSIFLGTALLQTWSGLRLICIDDPIQQMDEFNTVAFLDVLHGVIQRGRQVVLTTANKEFYQLMLRRYAYLNQHRTRFRALRLRSVNLTEGPDIADDSPCFLPDGMVRLGPPVAST